MAENVKNIYLNMPESTKPKLQRVPADHGKSCCSRAWVAVLVSGIILALLIVVSRIIMYGSSANSEQEANTTEQGPNTTEQGPNTTEQGPNTTKQESNTAIPEEALGCPPQWEKHGRKCYFFSSKKNQNWNVSRAECAALGSEMVVIDSREELEYLKKRSGHNYYFLGLTRPGMGQQWKWINNVEHNPAMFTIWNTHIGDYHCTVIGYGKVYTAHCNGSSTVQNLCEKAATIPARLQES